jgi:hypothetical protein
MPKPSPETCSRKARKSAKNLEIRNHTSKVRFSAFQSFQHFNFASSARNPALNFKRDSRKERKERKGASAFQLFSVSPFQHFHVASLRPSRETLIL